jgi:glycosyltransferase involved in cell wall biosynthesis
LTPRASVVIPTRDRPRMLAGALAGALAQRDIELEVIVVDDGSTSPIADLLPSDARVRVLRHDVSRGVSAARNTGIEDARAQWIAFLDDDDLWAPDKLASQIAAAAAAGAAWVYAGDVTVDEDLGVVSGAPPPPPEDVVASLSTYNSMPAGASNVVVRADALAAAGPFDPSLKTSEDWDMWIRLARCCGTPAVVSRPLVACRIHAGNVLPDLDAMIEEPGRLSARYGLSLEPAASLRRAAWACLRAGRRKDALRYYGRAIRRGDVVSAGRALVAIVHPAARRGSPHGVRRRSATGWQVKAEEWLERISPASVGEGT